MINDMVITRDLFVFAVLGISVLSISAVLIVWALDRMFCFRFCSSCQASLDELEERANHSDRLKKTN